MGDEINTTYFYPFKTKIKTQIRPKLIKIVRFVSVVTNFWSYPFSTEKGITARPTGRIKERQIIILKRWLKMLGGNKKNKLNPTRRPTPYLNTKTLIIEIHSAFPNLKWRKTPNNNNAKAEFALAKISNSSEKKLGITIPEKLIINATI